MRGYEPRGREFESLRARQLIKHLRLTIEHPLSHNELQSGANWWCGDHQWPWIHLRWGALEQCVLGLLRPRGARFDQRSVSTIFKSKVNPSSRNFYSFKGIVDDTNLCGFFIYPRFPMFGIGVSNDKYAGFLDL